MTFKLFSAILLCARILLPKANEDLLFTDSLLTPDENVTISFSPPFIINGLASDVDVTCSFTRGQVPAMTSIFSLVIAHSSTTDQPLYSYVASVNALEGHAHNISHDVEVISGLISNQRESSLHIRFKYPDSNLTGLYVCEVQGFDQIGKPVTKYAKVRFIYAEAQNSCKLIDGYLAELDTQEEMDFFREYLIKMNISYYFWSGATKQNGSWVNEHSPAVRPLFDWAPGEPTNYPSGNCQCSYPRNDWKLTACLCNSNRNDLGYVCEVPDGC
ncbi:C-type lectin domain family 3 member A-like isoform X2 [Biomphalaria pfeifferi]|uniref:C-type lectin domain family 3 member A-like isoform X2 n=1 Tax=Biomphalaria pfeifferi TaxID=112525 RepID=A0AAD8BJE5_BIOPF|nr:C-type lectin domain family 3 member A-like isoform X2 [Biomphalaria pfeifferi]